MRSCAVYRAGLVSYKEGLARQDEAGALVASGVWDGVLILLEHTPVITIGRGGGRENLLAGDEVLASRGVEIWETRRGGNITCHNPGQIVGYPVLNLSRWRKDVHVYVQMLEETIIRPLGRFNLPGARKAGRRGVWLGADKIAAIGVFVQGWITGHGFALNVDNDLSLFDMIVPCGIKDGGVTSLARHNCPASTAKVVDILQEEFGQVFDCRLSSIDKLDDYLSEGGYINLRRSKEDAGACTGLHP